MMMPRWFQEIGQSTKVQWVVGTLWSSVRWALMFIAAPAVLGWTVGSMASLAPPDSNAAVYAAVLPVIISLIGFVISSGMGPKKDMTAGAAAGFCVVIFCFALLWGHRMGALQQREGANRAAMQNIFFRHDALRLCLHLQEEFNKDSQDKGRPTVTLEKLCPNLR